MATNNQEQISKYNSGDIRRLISQGIQHELVNLPITLSELKHPIHKLNFLTKFLPYVCSPIKQVEAMEARIETGEDDLFSLL